MKKLLSLGLSLVLLNSTSVIAACASEIFRETYETLQQQPASQEEPRELDLVEFNDFNYVLMPQRERDSKSAKLIDLEITPNRSFTSAPSRTNLGLANFTKALQVPQKIVYDSINRSSPQPDSLTTSVVGVAPEGESNGAQKISITFSRDMVAPTTNFDTNNDKTKVDSSALSIAPKISGLWRWYSPRVLVFEPSASRLPRSTEFTVSIAKSFASDQHLALREGKIWKFSTTRAVLVGTSGGFDHLGACVLVTYGQPIKIASALSKIHMRFGGKEIALREASKAEVHALVDKFTDTEGCYCFVPDEPLPPNQDGKVVIEPGIEAVEGPLTSLGEAEKAIHTESDKLTCTSSENVSATSGKPWHIAFDGPMNRTNQCILDVDHMTKKMFTAEPPLPNMKVSASGNELIVRGNAIPKTEYVFTISAELPGYGAKLGKTVSVKLTSFSTDQSQILPPRSAALVVPPTGSTQLSIFSKNLPFVLVSVYAADKLCGKGKFINEANFQNLSNVQPELQKKLPCIHYDNDTNVSVLELSSLQKTKQNQYVIFTSVPADPESKVNAHDAPRPLPGTRTFDVRSKVTVGSKPKFEPVYASNYPIWLQFAPFNVTCLSSNNSSLLISTNFSNGETIKATSATLADRTFTKTAEGQFSLPIGLHVPEHYGASVKFNNNVAMVPTNFPLHRDQHSNCSMISVGDLRHAKLAQKFKLAGFLSGTTEGGDQCGAPEGELNFKINDSDGTIVCKGTATVKGGFFQAETLIPESAKTGAGKVTFEYTDPNKKLSLRFFSELQIELDSEKEVPAVVIVTDARDSQTGLPRTGSVTAIAKFEQTSTQPTTTIGWDGSVRFAKFVPMGWNDFKFGDSRSFDTNPIQEQWIEGSPTDQIESSAIFKYSNTSSVPVLFQMRASRNIPNVGVQTQQRSFVIQPSDLLIGIKEDSTNKSGKTTVAVTSVVTDLHGNVVRNRPIEIKILKDIKAKELFENIELAHLQIKSEIEPVKSVIEAAGTTDLLLVATSFDDQNRATRTIVNISPQVSLATPANAAPLAILTDKASYYPGETCHLRFAQPFERCNGFAALAVNKEITDVKIDERKPNVDIEYKIPNSLNGTYAGIVKLFDGKSIEKKIREAEGMFHLVVIPKTKQLRCKMEYVNKSSTESNSQLQLSVTDDNNQPVSNAAISVIAYTDGSESADWRDTQSIEQITNPIRTHLLASSISRGPELEISQTGRKPISEMPQVVQYNDDIDFSTQKLVTLLGSEVAIPLQTLRTDSEGKAELNFNLDKSHGDIRICSDIMTAQGDGFLTASLKIPRTESNKFEKFMKHSTINDETAHVSSKEQNDSMLALEQLQVAQSKILNFEKGDSTIVAPKDLSDFKPVSVVVSAAPFTTIAVAAERMAKSEPLTNDQRGSRIITLLSVLPFLDNLQARKRYTSVVTHDASFFQTLTKIGGFSVVGWIPVWNKDGVSRDLESPWNTPLLAHASAIARKRGIPWTLPEVFPADLCITAPYEMGSGGKFQENATLAGYGAYVACLMCRLNKYEFVGSIKSRLESYLYKINDFPAEAIAWFLLSKDDLKLSTASVQLLQDKFDQNVISELTLPPISADASSKQRGDCIRRHSAMLLAMVDSNFNVASIEKIKTLLETELVLPINDVSYAFASLALSSYYDKHFETSKQNATIDLGGGHKQEITFDREKLSVAIIPVSNAEQLRISGSKGLTYGIIYTKDESGSGSVHSGMTVKRSFRSATSDAKQCFLSANNTWHCSANAKLTELIEFIPEQRLEHIVVRECRNENAAERVSSMPECSIYAPLHYKEGYSIKWPQEIVNSARELTVYGSDLAPSVYRFEFQVTFPTAGTYRLPGVSAKSATEPTCFGLSAPQTMIVTP